jgi:hypothetical protein
MCPEASTVLRTVAVDFFFNWWYLEIPSDNRIRHVPRCVHCHAQGFRLETFYDFYVWSGSRTPELYSVSPDWFEIFFIWEKYAELITHKSKCNFLTSFRQHWPVELCNGGALCVPEKEEANISGHHTIHTASPLQRLIGYCCLGKQFLFNVTVIRNTKINIVHFFKLRNRPPRSMDLGFTQPLTKMSTRNLPEW